MYFVLLVIINLIVVFLLLLKIFENFQPIIRVDTILTFFMHHDKNKQQSEINIALNILHTTTTHCSAIFVFFEILQTQSCWQNILI